jgi:hypothetical protein
MDINAISKEIRAYTSGYPYLVSRLYQMIDEELEKDWTPKGIQEAIALILIEQSTLFDDLIKNVESGDSLEKLLRDIILKGEEFNYNADNPAIRDGLMFGFLRQNEKIVSVHNKIFELRLYNYFISLMETSEIRGNSNLLSSEAVENGKLNMPLIIKKFMQHYYELYNKSNQKFLEDECRLLFLTYLRPLINGKGFYHPESETRNRKRLDVIVDFGTARKSTRKRTSSL